MKLKNLFFVLMMVIASAVMAQEKYEQAVVSQETGAVLFISIEGKEYVTKDIKPRVRNSDLTPLLKEIGEMRNDGWEVWNSSFANGQGVIATYFLRRKLK